MNRDFIEMLSALSAAGADFLVVGAHALAVHGLPRATGDLDIWIRPSAENATRVHRALQLFGAPLTSISSDDFTQPDLVIQIGIVPCRIDVLTGLTGVSFEDAWSRRTELRLDDLTVPVIGRDDLIRNKQAVGRPQDLIDVAALREASTKAGQ
jgi:hypothetical protein